MHRRAFLGRLAALAGASFVGPSLWRSTSAGAAVVAGPGPYGALLAPDANGIALPAGFTSRVIATTGQVVGATTHPWHLAPDGGACFPVPGGGWVYVSNAEVSSSGGGAGAVRFAADGTIAAAYPILTGTQRNCAGGATPWGTWLSCEETGAGRVYECDPQQAGQGVQRPLLGTFNHEAAAVDPIVGHVYLTEDAVDGRLYRFTPSTPGDLTAGTLSAAVVSGTSVTWQPTSTTAPDRSGATTPFNGGEGAWIGGRTLWFTTKGDGRVWELDLDAQQLVVLYDDSTTAGGALTGVDNITVHQPSGDLFVAEDGGNMEVCLIASVSGQDVVAPFLRFSGHSASEVTGPAFSPDGSRLYVSSQRGTDGITGVTIEVTGPFRTSTEPPPPPPVTTVAQDGFNRSVSSSWGSADVGGSWTRTGPASSFSVGSGVGRIVLPSGGAVRAATLGSVSAADVDVTADLWLDKAATGGGTHVAVVVRKVGTTEYRLRGVLRPTNRSLVLMRVVNGTEATLATVTLPGGAYGAGQVLHLRLLVTGTGSTSLSGKGWFDGAAEPGSWQVVATDSTAALQRPGGVGVQTYISSSASNTPVTVSADNLRATTPQTGPPPNSTPTASFVASPDGLTLDVDGSASTDADGSIQTYSWSFGDGGIGSGSSPTATHTYSAPGTYTVTLTVTDDDGATAQASQAVTVEDATEPPPADVVAQDGFTRTLTGSWGSAEVGGAWTRSGPAADYSVSGSEGRVRVPSAGASRSATLTAVSALAVDASVALTLDKAPTGSGSIVSLVARKVGTTEYRLRAYLRSSSALQLLRVVNGAETVVGSVPIVVPGGLAPGMVVHLRFSLVGSALSGKVWFGAAAEPSAWTVQATDSTAALQRAGGVGVHVYVSGSASNAPVTLSADDLRALAL